MKFNQYTWNLYKQSSDGQKAIKEFEEPSNNDTMMDLVFKYNPRMKLWFNDDNPDYPYQTSVKAYGVTISANFQMRKDLIHWKKRKKSMKMFFFVG